MIESHGALTPPLDDDVLWRYLDFTKLVAMLEDNGLYFPQAKCLGDNYDGDKYEGALPKVQAKNFPMVVKLFSLPDNVEHAHVSVDEATLIKMCRETCYISCWHKNVHQSAAMWKLYLKSEEGVAIRTTFGRVKAAFAKTKEGVWAETVNYIDYSSERFNYNDFLSLVTHKRKSFEHEHEVRLIWHGLYDFITKERTIGLTKAEFEAIELAKVEGPSGRIIQVSLTDLIEEVLVSPSSPPWFHDLVCKVVKTYNLNCPVKPNDFNAAPIW